MHRLQIFVFSCRRQKIFTLKQSPQVKRIILNAHIACVRDAKVIISTVDSMIHCVVKQNIDGYVNYK